MIMLQLLIFFHSTCEITWHYKYSEIMWYISCLSIHVLCLWNYLYWPNYCVIFITLFNLFGLGLWC